ncbi:MAG: PIN domain-containing protein [Ginsengibacter sp.]
MVVHETILADTDILIKAYRGDKFKQKNLKLLKDKYCISVITACELLNGSKNKYQRNEFNKALRYYYIVFVDEKTSEIAFKLFKKYSFNSKMRISDSLIAATAIRNDLSIYTDNKNHFNFIDGIKFYNEK